MVREVIRELLIFSVLSVGFLFFLLAFTFIGITQPVNYENLTRADLPIKGLDLLQTLHERKQWELTEYIRE